MNPIILLRSTAGPALPVVLAVAAHKQRSRRSSTETDTVMPTNEPYDRLSGEVKTVHALMAFVDAEDDPVHAVFSGGRFDLASLRGWDLTGADFSRASMKHANLSTADLSGASLIETNLWNADLRGANLNATGAVSMADIRGAVFDLRTRWPEGFGW